MEIVFLIALLTFVKVVGSAMMMSKVIIDMVFFNVFVLPLS